MVESEEALDAEMAAAEDFLIQLSAKFLKIFQAFCHRSSGGTLSWQPASYYELTRATSAERGRGARFLHRLRLRRSSCCDWPRPAPTGVLHFPCRRGRETQLCPREQCLRFVLVSAGKRRARA